MKSNGLMGVLIFFLMSWQVEKKLEWKERGHKLNDQAALGDQAAMDALRNYGLLKFFMCPGMWAQPLLLERLVAMWDADSQCLWSGTKS